MAEVRLNLDLSPQLVLHAGLGQLLLLQHLPCCDADRRTRGERDPSPLQLLFIPSLSVGELNTSIRVERRGERMEYAMEKNMLSLKLSPDRAATLTTTLRPSLFRIRQAASSSLQPVKEVRPPVTCFDGKAGLPQGKHSLPHRWLHTSKYAYFALPSLTRF